MLFTNEYANGISPETLRKGPTECLAKARGGFYWSSL